MAPLFELNLFTKPSKSGFLRIHQEGILYQKDAFLAISRSGGQGDFVLSNKGFHIK